MIRTLMTTTALAVLLTGGAMAQSTTTTTDTTVVAPAAGTMNWDYAPMQGDHLATNIIGMQVYSSAAVDAELIGDINNLVVGQNGEVQAVVIGVGGFLGIGEKDVAVSMDSLEMAMAEDNTQRYVLQATREALNEAPAFEWDENAQMAAGTTTLPADGTMAPADQTAMAPADNTMADQTATGTVPGDNAMAPAAGTNAMSPLDRTTVQPFDATQLTADELLGTNVYGVNDEHIGTIGDLALNEDGSIDAIIIDFGGFLGIGTKPVAVAYEDLNFLADPSNNRSLSLPITRDQMDAAPAFDENTYAADRTTQRVVVGANTQS
jgi:sporulation protein YlmC with PRC-barrel domain